MNSNEMVSTAPPNPGSGELANTGVSGSSIPAPALSIRVLRTVEEVESIRGVWSSWKTHRDSDIDFCLSFAWSRDVFVRPHVIVIYRYGHPDAILVGRIERNRIAAKIGYLKLPGMPVKILAFTYRGLLGNASVENVTELVKSIMSELKKGEADVAFLHQLNLDSPMYETALQLPGFASRDRLTVPLAHYVMRLPENIDKVFQGFSSGLRAEVRRKKRKILSDFEGKVAVQCFRKPEDLPKVFPDLEAISAKTYQRALGVGFQDTEEMRRRLRLCAQKGWIRIYLVTIDGAPCAFWIGTVYEGSFCSDYNGYDPRIRDYSIGSFLLITMIEDFCREGVKNIDFGFGGAEYKERFGNDHWMEASVSIFAPTTNGIAVNTALTAAGAIDETLKKLLGKTNLLPRIKRLWRARLAKAQP